MIKATPNPAAKAFAVVDVRSDDFVVSESGRVEGHRLMRWVGREHRRLRQLARRDFPRRRERAR
jgi:hypothetical protein